MSNSFVLRFVKEKLSGNAAGGFLRVRVQSLSFGIFPAASRCRARDGQVVLKQVLARAAADVLTRGQFTHINHQRLASFRVYASVSRSIDNHSRFELSSSRDTSSRASIYSDCPLCCTLTRNVVHNRTDLYLVPSVSCAHRTNDNKFATALSNYKRPQRKSYFPTIT